EGQAGVDEEVERICRAPPSATRFRPVILGHHRESFFAPLPGSSEAPLSELHPVEEPRDPHEGPDAGPEGEVHRSCLRVRAVRDDDEGQAKPGAREAGIAFPAPSLESTSTEI